MCSAITVVGPFSGGFRERNKTLRIRGNIRDGQVRLWGEAVLLPPDDVRGKTNVFDTTIPFGPNGLSAKLSTLREGNCKVVLNVSLSRK